MFLWAVPPAFDGIFANEKNVLDFGAKCDGVSVDNQAFLNSLAATGSATVPGNRTCIVDSLELPNNSRISGLDRTTSNIKPGSTGNIFIVTGTAAAHKLNVSIENLSFSTRTGSNVAGTAVLNASYADNISVTNNNSMEIQLLFTNRAFKYGDVLPSWLNKNTIFSGNLCKSVQVEHDACAEFAYVDQVTAHANKIYGFHDSLFYWGGDANKDGAIENPRWAQHIEFDRNYIDGSRAGVWGSMGRGVILSANTVSNIADVGIDFEGTIDGQAIGNSCTNAVNGCATTFFLNRNIIFSGNTITQAKAGQPMFRLYNSTLSNKNQDISVNENTFQCKDSIALCTVDNRSGPCRRLNVSRNMLSGTTIDFAAAVNQGDEAIEKNKLTFDRVFSGSAIKAAVFGRATATVTENTILSRVPQPSAVGIVLTDSDFNNGNSYRASSNTISGFETGIALITNGANPGIQANFFVKGNNLDIGRIVRTDRNLEKSRVTR